MSVPTNLFIDAPEIDDVSMINLSSNSDEWSEEIVASLKERVPDSGRASISIKFMKKDDEMGAATGSITVAMNDKVAVIPVIIKDFKMYPLDIFFADEKILPLNGDYFRRFFSDGNSDAFSSLEEFPSMGIYSRYMRGESLYNTIYPPNWGRYAYASAKDEKYPMISEISSTIRGGEEFAKKALADEKVVARLGNNGHLGLIEKIANLKPVNMQEFRQGVDNLVMRTTHVIKKDGPNRYTLLSNQNNQFNPAITEMDRTALKKFLSQASDDVYSYLHEVDQNGEKVLIPEECEHPVFTAKPYSEIPEDIESFGFYNVRTAHGLNLEGLAITKVIDFNQEMIPTKLFLGKGMSSMQPDIAGAPIRGRRYIPEGECPKVGQTGTFLYVEDGKDGVATEPVTIKSVMIVEDCCDKKMHIKAITLQGTSIDICIGGHKLERIAAMPQPDGDVKYLVPGSMRWIPMEGFVELSNSPADYAVKVAYAKNSSTSVTLKPLGYGEYGLKGCDKYASAMGWDANRLQSHQAKFLLASFGANEGVIDEGIKYANKKGHVHFQGVVFPDTHEEKVASYRGRASELVKQASELRRDLTKEASYMEDSQTLDSLLSLNFINAENISNFISKIPVLKATLSHLASCLLASRLGMREIPQDSTSSAINKLNDVVNGLEILRAVNVNKGKK